MTWLHGLSSWYSAFLWWQYVLHVQQVKPTSRSKRTPEWSPHRGHWCREQCGRQPVASHHGKWEPRRGHRYSSTILQSSHSGDSTVLTQYNSVIFFDCYSEHSHATAPEPNRLKHIKVFCWSKMLFLYVWDVVVDLRRKPFAAQDIPAQTSNTNSPVGRAQWEKLWQTGQLHFSVGWWIYLKCFFM